MSNVHTILMKASEFHRNPLPLWFSGQSLSTVFSDDEAFAICGGITESRQPLRLWVQRQRGKLKPGDTFSAHDWAMRVVAKYGLPFALQCLRFPPVPFKFGDAKKMFSEFDHSAYMSKSNPRVRLVSETGEKLSLEFHIKETQDRETSQIDPNLLVLHSETRGRSVATISRGGILTPLGGEAILKPLVTLLVQFSKDPVNMIVHYGRTLGECSYCGRELLDLRSLKVGYGKACARRYGVPW